MNPAVLRRPAVIVKIDAAPDARPQRGLDRADVIIEERVEGGLARYMAIFQSEDVDAVGPVRSVRSTDPPVVRAFGGLFAYSGGIPPFIRQLHAEGGVVDLGIDADTPAYQRRSDRPAPHNLYTSTTLLRQRTPPNMGPPPALLPFLPAGQPFSGADATSASAVTVQLGSRSSSEWRWDTGSQSWLRFTDGSQHILEDGPQLSAKTVIIEFVPYVATPYRDTAHAVVDRAVVVGSGDGWLLSSGQMEKVRWSKPAATDMTTFTDATGAAVAVPPGPVWITLAPAGAAVGAAA